MGGTSQGAGSTELRDPEAPTAAGEADVYSREKQIGETRTGNVFD